MRDGLSSETQTQVHFTILRRGGARITPLVRAVVNQLFDSGSALSVEKLREQVGRAQGWEITPSSIYRVVDRLTRAGLLRRLHRGENRTRYFLCRNPRDAHHHHFICTQCNAVKEVDFCVADRVESFVEKHLHATVTGHVMQFEGMCESCR